MEQVNLQVPLPEAATRRQLRRGMAAGMHSDAFMEIFERMTAQMGQRAIWPVQEGQAAWQAPEEEPGACAMMGELAGMACMPTGLPLPDQVQADAAPEQVSCILQPAGEPERSDTRSGSPQAKESAEQDVPILEAAYTQVREAAGTDGGRALRQGQGEFRSAVEQAKQQLSGTRPAEEKKQETVRSDLPASAETTAPQRTAPPERTERGAQTQPLSAQIEKGLAEQLPAQRKEFTMKLKPASLGEITVRLVEKEGRTTLSIITASTETAKAINGDLAALREAMRPMAVEVQAAVPRTPENAQAQQFGMTGQQLQQQFQQQRQSYPGRAGAYCAPAPEQGESEQDLIAPALSCAGLDTYI